MPLAKDDKKYWAEMYDIFIANGCDIDITLSEINKIDRFKKWDKEKLLKNILSKEFDNYISRNLNWHAQAIKIRFYQALYKTLDSILKDIDNTPFLTDKASVLGKLIAAWRTLELAKLPQLPQPLADDINKLRLKLLLPETNLGGSKVREVYEVPDVEVMED